MFRNYRVLSQSVVWQLSCGLCCQKDDGKYPSALGHFAAFRYFYRDVSTFSKIHLFFLPTTRAARCPENTFCLVKWNQTAVSHMGAHLAGFPYVVLVS